MLFGRPPFVSLTAHTMASMTATLALVPVLSVLMGAAITYWLNVHARNRTRVEDIYHDAIASAALLRQNLRFEAGMSRLVVAVTSGVLTPSGRSTGPLVRPEPPLCLGRRDFVCFRNAVSCGFNACFENVVVLVFDPYREGLGIKCGK